MWMRWRWLQVERQAACRDSGEHKQSREEQHWRSPFGCNNLAPKGWRDQTDTGCGSIQGLHPSEAAYEGQLCHNATRRLSQFEGSSKYSPQMQPPFSLFFEGAPLLSFTASHIPRFFVRPKKKEERSAQVAQISHLNVCVYSFFTHLNIQHQIC